MGITRLYPFLQQRCTKGKGISPLMVASLKGKKVGVDATYFLHKWAFSTNKDMSHIKQLFLSFARWLIQSAEVIPLFVFDGEEKEPIKQPAHQKRHDIHAKDQARLEQVQEQLIHHKKQQSVDLETAATPSLAVEKAVEKDIRNSALEQEEKGKAGGVVFKTENESQEIHQLLEYEQKLKTRLIRVTREDVEEIRLLLTTHGLLAVEVARESDPVLAKLSELGIIDMIASEDSDFLVYNGSHTLVRHLDEARYMSHTNETIKKKKPHVPTVYYRPEILKELRLTSEQFIEVCMLMGCDYIKEKLPKVGPFKAVGIIQRFGTVDRYLRKPTTKALLALLSSPDEFQTQVAEARRNFALLNPIPFITECQTLLCTFDAKKALDALIPVNIQSSLSSSEEERGEYKDLLKKEDGQHESSTTVTTASTNSATNPPIASDVVCMGDSQPEGCGSNPDSSGH